MDTELARTFLAVIAEGNFIKAADKLNMTQSAVSARIHRLEEQLGCSLFVRNKAGTALTASGKHFQKFAFTLVRTAEQARQEIGVPSGYEASLTVGGRFGLWEGFLLDWLGYMETTAPNVSIRAEIGFENDLMQGLVEGRIDVGIMYTPQSRPGLNVELLLEEKLVLVSSKPVQGPILNTDYVYVDWGPEFYAKHSASFPDFMAAGLTSNIGWLGFRHILQKGGSGYFPLRIVKSYIDGGEIHLIPGAAEFRLPAYVVYPEGAVPDHYRVALDGMYEIAKGLEVQLK